MTTIKGNILLDLDQTLISAESTTEEDEFDWEKHGDKAKKFKYKDMDGYYIVFERPGLQKFLDFLFANFNVSVWTAASKDYALFIIEKIILQGKKNRHIDWVFFSYHCDISKRIKNGTKDLSIIWEEYSIPGYTKDNTVIIDDYDEVYKTQPDNCIIAFPFEFTDDGSENDRYLSKLQPHLVNMKKSIQNGSGKPAAAVNTALKA
jgi:TFIIF-interacting CTD phosphatase-like protein